MRLPDRPRKMGYSFPSGQRALRRWCLDAPFCVGEKPLRAAANHQNLCSGGEIVHPRSKSKAIALGAIETPRFSRIVSSLSDVTLSRARRPQKEGVFLFVDEFRRGELMDELAIHFFVEIKIEIVKCLFGIPKLRLFQSSSN